MKTFLVENRFGVIERIQADEMYVDSYSKSLRLYNKGTKAAVAQYADGAWLSAKVEKCEACGK